MCFVISKTCGFANYSEINLCQDLRYVIDDAICVSHAICRKRDEIYIISQPKQSEVISHFAEENISHERERVYRPIRIYYPTFFFISI